eukprot:gene10888-6940_t
MSVDLNAVCDPHNDHCELAKGLCCDLNAYQCRYTDDGARCIGLPGYAYGAIAVGSILVLAGLAYRQGRKQSLKRLLAAYSGGNDDGDGDDTAGGDDSTRRIPTVEELTTFGHHVALAMTFLESLQKPKSTSVTPEHLFANVITAVS